MTPTGSHYRSLVRFGSKADMRSAPTHVRFVPKADMARVSARLVRQIDGRSLQIEDINLQLHRGRIIGW